MNYRHGSDVNQKAIVAGLRKCGFSVEVTAALGVLGHGFPDLVVGAHGRTFLFEVKQSPKHHLTDSEVAFRQRWKGGPLHVITSLQEAIDCIKSAMGKNTGSLIMRQIGGI